MSFADDYTPEVSVTTLQDHEVEQLLSRSAVVPNDLADLEKFISAMAVRSDAPRDVEYMATSLAAVARSSARPKRSGFRRLAVLTASMAILFAFSGIAMAANGASPGDALYSLDGLLEEVGIGDGGVDERIDEFDALRAGGSVTEAYLFLGRYIETADAEEALVAAQHLVVAANGGESNSVAAQEKVAAILAFIEANQGNIGLDGSDFGRGVAAIARGTSEQPQEPNPGKEPESSGNGQGGGSPSDDAGQPEGTPANEGNPVGQGQSNEGTASDPGETGPPDDAGPPEDAGPPDDADVQEDGGPPEDPGPPEDKDQSAGDTPGDSSPGATAPGATNPGNGSSTDDPGKGNGRASEKANENGRP